MVTDWLQQRTADPAALAAKAQDVNRQLRALARALDDAATEALDALDAEPDPDRKDALCETVSTLVGNAKVVRDIQERLDHTIRGGIARHAEIDRRLAARLGPS